MVTLCAARKDRERTKEKSHNILYMFYRNVHICVSRENCVWKMFCHTDHRNKDPARFPLLRELLLVETPLHFRLLCLFDFDSNEQYIFFLLDIYFLRTL